jgi:hypothetical protein
MLPMARKELQRRYIEALQKHAKISKELAIYYADRADENQMMIYLQDKKESASPEVPTKCPASPPVVR